MSRHLLLTAVLVASCSRPAPQPAPAPAHSDPLPAPVEVMDTAGVSQQRALALLDRAFAAAGGREAVIGLRGFEIALESRPTRGNWAQARDWRDTTPFPVPTLLRYLVDLEGMRATHEFLNTAPGGIQFNYRNGYDSAGAWQVDLLRWRLGDDLLRGPGAAARANIAAIVRLVPQGALRQALLARESLRREADRMVGTRQVGVVSYTERLTGQVVHLAIDSATGALASVIIPAGNAALRYDDVRVVNGFAVPHLRTQLANGQPVAELRLARVDFAPRMEESRFAPPQGYVPPPAATPAAATRLADGIYRLDNMPGGYHSAFVVGQSGVVVLEAPLSAAHANEALRLIGEVAPGRPVTHVMVTHHHSDHVGGLGPYVARGATVVVGKGFEEAIRRQLPDSLRARATFDTVGARPRTFGNGAARVTAIPVPNTHADGNVAYYLPASRILFQGDLFYLPERGAVPAAFPVTDALVAAMRPLRLRVDAVVGVHGRSGTWADVEESIRLRPQPTIPPSR